MLKNHGKSIWVKPYYKGEDRNKQDSYYPKEYRFLKKYKFSKEVSQ